MPNNNFNGSEGAYIERPQASQSINNYISSPCFKENKEVKGHFFGRDKILELLSQQGSMGLRIYYGKDASSNPMLIVVAADANGDDILDGDRILDFSLPCPTHCGQNALLD